MCSSIILKKEQHWYILPETENRDELIISLVEQESPGVIIVGDDLSNILSRNGWSIEEYQDFAIVA